MIEIQSDKRFVHVKGCEIHSLYKRVPGQFGGYKIDISYQGNDIFRTHFSIDIDQSKFAEETVELIDGKKDRIYFTDAMTDIDMLKIKGDWCIYYSPNDGKYIYFFFSDDEFIKLKQWVELEIKNK